MAAPRRQQQPPRERPFVEGAAAVAGARVGRDEAPVPVSPAGRADGAPRGPPARRAPVSGLAAAAPRDRPVTAPPQDDPSTRVGGNLRAEAADAWPQCVTRHGTLASWRRALGQQLPRASTKLDLGLLLIEFLFSHPGQPGHFLYTYFAFSTLLEPSRRELRARDLLPLALPPLSRCARWVASLRGGRRDRIRHRQAAEAAALEAWTILCVFALNFEFCGRCEEGASRICRRWSAAQTAAVTRIQSAVQYYLRDALTAFPPTDWAKLADSVRVDYSLNVVARSLPLRLGELRPGLPSKGVAAKLRAQDYVDDDVLAWLENPALVVRPESEWPDQVPTAKIQVECIEDWHAVAAHLFELGILDVIE